MDTTSNIVESVVLQWLRERNLKYKKTSYGFETSAFNIKCIPNTQSVPVYKEKNDRMVAEWALRDHVKKLSTWIDGRPTLRIEKLNIVVDNSDKILIRGFKDDVIICEAEFWKEDDCLFWADTRYHGYHVPGWLSKCLRTIERMNLNIPIEVMTNAIDSSYHRIGFKAIAQTDVREYNKRMGYTYMPYLHPENIIIWKLRYDNKCTV